MIAKVTVAPKVSADITTIHATELKVQRLYVECDMQDWQFPEALAASSLTRKQTVDLDNRKFILKSAAYFVILFGLIVAIALVHSHQLETKTSEGVRIGLTVLLSVILFALFFNVIRTRDPVMVKVNRKVHAEWTALFLDPEKRAAQSRRYRFQRWLRQKYTARNNTKAARERVEEPESQLPKRGIVALSSFRRFFEALSNLSLWEKVSLVRLSLCFSQLGLLACLDQALAGNGLQSTAIALTFLPVILLLIVIPVHWVYYNPSEGRSIMNDLVGMVAWIIHMGVLTEVIRSPLLKRHHSVGVAAVVLAAVQILVIICLIIERQLSWFAQQWEKSPVIYYDLFEDPHEERDEIPLNACCDCFGQGILEESRHREEKRKGNKVQEYYG
ncbi:hypothetical protein V500_06266 [Pseudogymnoascus sp. VKM F-4518 (FW-2643)]|nr:hypothetical protein V500_06266 [Pseudogymnoascus sp. VKM F-4518 (FW-2643)]